jgi:hypothetical protein
VTVALLNLFLRSPIEAIDAGSHRVFAGGLHVTSRSRCRRIRAFCRPIPSASAPRPARDIRKDLPLSATAMHAVARARQRGRSARLALDGVVRASASELDGTRRCTSADDPRPTAQAGTRLCTQCNIGGVAAASSHAYRTNFIAKRGGSILASTPGSILASVEGYFNRGWYYEPMLTLSIVMTAGTIGRWFERRKQAPHSRPDAET